MPVVLPETVKQGSTFPYGEGAIATWRGAAATPGHVRGLSGYLVDVVFDRVAVDRRDCRLHAFSPWRATADVDDGEPYTAAGGAQHEVRAKPCIVGWIVGRYKLNCRQTPALRLQDQQCSADSLSAKQMV